MTDAERGGQALPGDPRPRLLSLLAVRLLAIGAEPGDSADEQARKSLLVAVLFIVWPAGVLWGVLYLVFDEPVAALFPWTYSVLSLVCLAIFARRRSYRFLWAVELLLILVTPAMLSVALGGLVESSGVILWSLLAPVGAVVFAGPTHAWRWFAAFLALLAASIVLAPLLRPDGADLPEGAVLAFAGLNIAAVSAVVFGLLVSFARQRELAQQRVESLLLNILPDEIAQRLQAERQAIADHYEEASILFADVVDFTPLSSRLDPRALVSLLDRLFTSFDDLADRYGVEKIKTIGDCYMVAAGVPRPRPDHAHALANMAFDMHDCARECVSESGEDMQLRIGISSGPVVAGVIGRRRFLYDLWGDTVNMASRMESHGSPGMIQVTRPTWELLRDEYELEPRGLVPVKGKGEVETWQLVRPRVRPAA